MTIDSNLGKVDEVMTALYDIYDPEIGMSIVDLDLIKAVEIGADGAPTEIKMVLTTPFCPWAGELIQDVKTKAEDVVGPPVKVTLLAERWEPPPGLFYALASSTISRAVVRCVIALRTASSSWSTLNGLRTTITPCSVR